MPASDFVTYKPAVAPSAQISARQADRTLAFLGPEFVLFRSQGIKPLVMFSDARTPELPEVPTAKEIGVGTAFEERVIAFAPKGTPKDRVEVIATALRAAMSDPELIERYKGLGIDGVFVDGPS